MFKNYFKTALRTLGRHKLYTILNVAGLTFGMSCFLLIGLYIFDEVTFDTQHSKADRIYRVIEHKKQRRVIRLSLFERSDQGNKK